MQYLKMLPYQIREAIEKNTPVVFPLGVVEYHAEHLPLGVDCFTCINAIERVEKRHPEIIVLPPFYYGAASLAVAAPEKNGTVHVDALKLVPVAEEIFKGLLRVGFRNIHCFIAHQTEEFNQGMPTDLAFRLAARHTIFDWVEKESGEGWWGTEKFSDYYSNANNPFNWIRVHTCRENDESGEHARLFPGDHAGKLETSETMAIYPELVELDRIDDTIWFARAGKEASAEYGDAALEMAADDIEITLFGKK
ncbi:MAG: creatininase family protein [Lentisphaeria bacterium]|nr:creatininase family protein [Lentisphaeria bacterium]